MHAYSKEFRYGNYVHVLLAAIAAALTYYFTIRAFTNIDLRALGTFVFIYGGLELLFEHLLWRFVTALPFVNLENLSGRWTGNIILGGNGKNYDAEITIRQTWWKIGVEFVSGGKGGQSYSASVLHNRWGNGHLELVYNYFAKDLETGNPHFDHDGTAILKLHKTGKKLNGKYYTQKSQQSWGHMNFKQVGNNPLPKWFWAIVVALPIVVVGCLTFVA